MNMNILRITLLALTLGTIIGINASNAQVPLLTRQLYIQHNGSGKQVQIIAPTIDSSYTLTLPTGQGANGSVLSNDGTGTLSWTSTLNAATINGTTNYLTKYTSATSLGTSVLYDNGSNIGIGTTSPDARLHITASSASTKGLILRGAASATANLLEIQNSSSTINMSIDPNGDITRIKGVTYSWPSSKPDSAISTTQLGSGILEVSHTGAMSWRQMTVSTATLNFPITATRTSSDLSFNVTGAATGDAVSLGVPNAAVLVNTCYTAWVSAANTVTVRFNNYDNAEKNPASAVFKVMILK
jgi:hypothetical protein